MFYTRRTWLSTGQAAVVPPVQLPALDSSIPVFNLWQVKKTAGSKWTHFQHWQQSISPEPREAPRREEQQFAGTGLHQGLQQLVSPPCSHTGREGGSSLHPFLCIPASILAPPEQDSWPRTTHTAHRLRFSTYNSALDSATGKMTISSKIQFFK